MVDLFIYISQIISNKQARSPTKPQAGSFNFSLKGFNAPGICDVIKYWSIVVDFKELERERKEFERRLEVAWLIGAQQALANLNMQIKLDLMRMGNLQLMSGHDFIFLCIHLHQIN